MEKSQKKLTKQAKSYTKIIKIKVIKKELDLSQKKKSSSITINNYIINI